MKYLTQIPVIEEIAKRNFGLIKYADLVALKIEYYAVQQLIRRGIIEKIRNGTYRLVSQAAGFCEIEQLRQLYPQSVLCMESALYHYHYIERKPECWHLAIDRNTSKTLFQQTDLQVKPHYIDGRYLNYGIEIVLIDGFSVDMHSRDRLICECLKYENRFDPRDFELIIRRYREDKNSNIGKLAYFAYLRKVYKKFSRLFDFHGFEI